MSGAGASNERIALERFSELWEFETAPPDVFEFAVAHPGLTPGEKAALCGHDQIRRWPAGVPLPAETYLDRFPDVAAEKSLKLQLIVGEFVCSQQQGLEPSLGDLLARFPDLCEELRVQLAARGDERPPATAASARPPSRSVRPWSALIKTRVTGRLRTRNLPAPRLRLATASRL